MPRCRHTNAPLSFPPPAAQTSLSHTHTQYTWCADSEDAQRHRRGKQRRADMLGTLSNLMGPVGLAGRSRTSRSPAGASGTARSPMVRGRAPVVPNSKSGRRASQTANATMNTVSEFMSAPSADLL